MAKLIICDEAKLSNETHRVGHIKKSLETSIVGMKADLRTEGQRIGQIKESRELALLKKEKNSKLKNRDSKDEVVKAFREEVKRMRSRRMGFQSVKDGVYRNTRGARTATRAWQKNKEDKTHPHCEIKGHPKVQRRTWKGCRIL